MKTRVMITVLVSLVVFSILAVAMLIPAKAIAKGKPDAPGEKAKAPDLVKIEFIHWKKGFAKPPCNNDGVCDPDENPSCRDCKNGDDVEPDPTEPTCYAFMGKYGKTLLKWKELPVAYVINPNGFSQSFVTGAVSAGAEEWDYYAGPELFNNAYTVDYSVLYRVQDGKNAICFQDYYADPGIIGACTVWYSPATKQIAEFDIVFETNFSWGDAGPTDETGLGDTDLMDLQNIATHELGHAAGLADVYDDGCSEVTMYGYSVEGETKKRTLEEPDVVGIVELYP